jgi:hypothetical protein
VTNGSTLRRIAFASRRALAGVATLILILLSVGPGRADAIDGLEVDLRARLAVAASAYSLAEAPALDPDSPSFAPNTVGSYLETDADGHYASGTFKDGMQISFTLLRHADDAAAVAGLEAWKASGDAPVLLDWGGSFPVFRRGQGLLGVSMLGAGSVARGQSGRWHFEVSVVPQNSAPGSDTGASELAVLADAMRTLSANALRYRVFPRELVVAVAIGGSSRRLAPGQSFQVPLQMEGDTEASFTLQVLDGGKPVEAVRYRVTLAGTLAAAAKYVEGGSRAARTEIETASPTGEPVVLTWAFPPVTSPEVARMIDEGDTSLSLAVEARLPPKVLP